MDEKSAIHWNRYSAIGIAMLFGLVVAATIARTQGYQSAGSVDWDRIVEAGRKECNVTVSISASADLRRPLEKNFKRPYLTESIRIISSMSLPNGCASSA